MNTDIRQKTKDFHTSFHPSSHYFRVSQPQSKFENTKSVSKKADFESTKGKAIDVFEFEPVGFMCNDRW